jgi:hypothetical protein
MKPINGLLVLIIIILVMMIMSDKYVVSNFECDPTVSSSKPNGPSSSWEKIEDGTAYSTNYPSGDSPYSNLIPYTLPDHYEISTWDNY